VFVLASAADGKPRVSLRRVRSSGTLGDDVIVLDGLQAGERVATTGSFKLREGALVQIANAEPKPQ
jgi:membrane fusion protein (multidrug efflux system)